MRLHHLLQNPIRLLISAHWITGVFILCISLVTFGHVGMVDTIIACVFFLTSFAITLCNRFAETILLKFWKFIIMIDFLCALELVYLHHDMQYDYYYFFYWCVIETAFLFGWLYGILATVLIEIGYGTILFCLSSKESIGLLLVRLLLFAISSLPLSYASYLMDIWKASNESKSRLLYEKEKLVQELETITKQMTEYTFDVQNLAVMDRLTQLFNQTYFHNRLMVEVEKARQSGEFISLALFDIDNFKRFNDSFGHACGDDVLKIVSEAIQVEVKRTYGFAARIGGEELVIVMPGTDIEEAFQFATRICKTISTLSYCFENDSTQRISITVSGGVATFPSMVMDATTLTKYADAAMYAAKTAGKNRVFRYDQLETHANNSGTTVELNQYN